MPFQIDRAKTARENFVDLVNTGSTYVFTGTEFEENGVPEVYVGDPGVSNTEITLDAVEGSGFIGVKTVYYRRLAPGATRTAAALEFDIIDTDTLTTLKEMICEEHNLVSSEVTLTGVLPTVVDESELIQVVFNANSLLYTAGQFEVTVTLTEVV